MNKTDPRVIKTLHRIDEALLDNLKNHDFRKITVDTLCRSARINRSTFYKYYSDKYDLLDNFLNRILSEFSEATISTGFILASPYYNTNEKFIQDFEKMIEFIYGRLEIYRILWTASIDRSIYTEMESIIRQNVNKILQSELSAPPDGKTACYHDLYARLLASNFLTLVRWWVTNQPSISRSDVVSVMEGSIRKAMVFLAKHGLKADPACIVCNRRGNRCHDEDYCIHDQEHGKEGSQICTRKLFCLMCQIQIEEGQRAADNDRKDQTDRDDPHQLLCKRVWFDVQKSGKSYFDFMNRHNHADCKRDHKAQRDARGQVRIQHDFLVRQQDC